MINLNIPLVSFEGVADAPQLKRLPRDRRHSERRGGWLATPRGESVDRPHRYLFSVNIADLTRFPVFLCTDVGYVVVVLAVRLVREPRFVTELRIGARVFVPHWPATSFG